MNRRIKYSLILGAEMILWNTVLMKPIRLFSVFLHEIGHVIMALLFGSKIHSFQVNLDESGSVLTTSSGWLANFAIASGGYLGGVLLSIILLMLGYKFGGRYVLGITAIILVTVSAVFSGISVTLLYATAFSLFVILILMIKKKEVENTALEVLGIGAMTYGVYDTFIDTVLYEINKAVPVIQGWDVREKTDAMQMGSITGIPAVVWGILWLGISLAVIYFLLFKYGKKSGMKPKQKKLPSLVTK